MNFKIINKILELYTFKELDLLKSNFLSIFKEHFNIQKLSLLNLAGDDFTYSFILTTLEIDNYENISFFDIEIEQDIPFTIEINNTEFPVHYRCYIEIDGFKYAFLIHEKKDIDEELLNLILKVFIISYKNILLLEYYQNSAIINQCQINILNEIAELLGVFDLDRILTRLLENATNISKGDVGAIFLYDKDEGRLKSKIAWGVRAEILEKIIIKKTKLPVIYETFREKETRFFFKTDESVAEIEFPEEVHVYSYVALPLFTKNENLGVIIILNFELEQTFVDNELIILETLSKIASIGIENSIFFKRSLEQEKINTQLVIASDIQKNLLPENDLEKGEYLISGISIPAMNVGGDFFNYLAVDDKLYAFLGDVSGKGIPAALLTTMAMIVIKTHINQAIDMDKILFTINNTISKESLGENYLTFAMFEIDILKNIVSFSGCSQVVLYYDSQKEEVIECSFHNLPVGMFEDIEYEVKKLNFNKGDIFLTFSDGITDAVNIFGEDFGLERVKKLIKENSSFNAKSLKKLIVKSVMEFSNGAEQFDDLTLLVIKRA